MRISVAMTTCNGGEFVAEQLQSILDQSRPADEILVFDDASDDNTRSLLQQTREDRPAIAIQLRGNRVGLVRNVEAVLAATTGDVIVLADQDDIWAPDKLAAVERAFSRPQVALWFSDAELIDQDGELLGRTAWQAVRFGQEPQQRVREGRGLERLLYGQTVTGATMAVRADVVRAALPLPSQLEGSDHVFLHDGWLAVLASLMGEVVCDPRRLTYYRQHPSQFTQQSMSAPDLSAGTPHSQGDLRNEHRRVRLVASRGREIDLPLGSGAFAELLARERLLATRCAPDKAWRRRRDVMRHALAGDYVRYANGWRSVLRDLAPARLESVRDKARPAAVRLRL